MNKKNINAALLMSTDSFVIEGFKTVTLNNIYFVNAFTWLDPTQTFILKQIITIKNSAPNAALILNSVRLHTKDITLTFALRDLPFLEELLIFVNFICIKKFSLLNLIKIHGGDKNTG